MLSEKKFKQKDDCTLYFCVCSLLAAANINHHESFGGLVKACDKIFKTGPGCVVTTTAEGLSKTSFIQENVHHELKLTGFVEGLNVILD